MSTNIVKLSRAKMEMGRVFLPDSREINIENAKEGELTKRRIDSRLMSAYFFCPYL